MTKKTPPARPPAEAVHTAEAVPTAPDDLTLSAPPDALVPPVEPETYEDPPAHLVVSPEDFADPEPEPTYYELASWRGLALWKCTLCSFDTLKGEEDIFEHYTQFHNPPPPPPPPSPIIRADRYGRPVA